MTSVIEKIRRGEVEDLRQTIVDEGFDRAQALTVLRYLAAYEEEANKRIEEAMWVGACRLLLVACLVKVSIWAWGL